MPPGTTPRDHIIEMAKAASLPFQIKVLSKDLEVQRSIRGRGYFGGTGKVIEKIMQNYPALRWWLGCDGLVIDEASNKLNDLSQFDRMAGALIADIWKNGHLSKESLVEIAKKLDNERFKLKDCLQPAQGKPIADYNRKKPREPIRTFSDAAGHPRLVRGVRRRLYLARNRYSQASRGARIIPDQF